MVIGAASLEVRTGGEIKVWVNAGVDGSLDDGIVFGEQDIRIKIIAEAI